MGIPTEDCSQSGELLGLKMVANEFVSYQKMADWIRDGVPVVTTSATGDPVTTTKQLNPRTVVIMQYALCGFSNFGSIGIQIGGIGAPAPNGGAIWPSWACER